MKCKKCGAEVSQYTDANRTYFQNHKKEINAKRRAKYAKVKKVKP